MKNGNRIFALGFFDGVHLGHQALLRECTALASKLGIQAAAITFDRHPMALFAETPPLLTTEQDRLRLLRQYGIGSIHTITVTREHMATPWETFLDELVEMGAAGFVCGDDFRFGAGGLGNGEGLTAFCQSRNLPCIIVPEQTVDGRRVSSTYIRSQIADGDMATAVRFLGHPHMLSGQVIPGHQLGRRLGIPTANLRLPEGLVMPKFGVYACRCLVDGAACPAVTNVGVRPTVAGEGVTVEPWILNYDGDLYGREITLEFWKFLRPERKFDSLEALKAEIHRNAQETRDFFALK